MMRAGKFHTFPERGEDGLEAILNGDHLVKNWWMR